MCWFFTRKPTMTETPKTQALAVALCFDLMTPDSPTMEVGVLRVRGDTFASFTWTVDPEGLATHLPPFSESLVRGLPMTLRATADTWLPFKNRSVPAWRKADDPKTLADYYCRTLRQSSIFVSSIEGDPTEEH